MHMKNDLSNFLSARALPRSPNQTHIRDLSPLRLVAEVSAAVCSKGVYIDQEHFSSLLSVKKNHTHTESKYFFSNKSADAIKSS